MKLTSLGAWAVSTMAVTAGLTYLFTPDGGASATPTPERPIAAATPSESASGEVGSTTEKDPTALARFAGGSTVAVDARLANAKLARGRGGDTYLLVELRGGEVEVTRSAPAHLGLVIDRSGSMQGQRIKNAISAAVTAVDRLNDGDSVSVVAFDTQALVVVPPTPLDARSRDEVKKRIEAISLGGDTCISCGMDAEMSLADQTSGKTQRMIVLSDGDTNNGVRDPAGLRELAQRARQRGITVTSIGVDLQFNERIMAALAEGGEGRHYFVQRPDDLARVFETEAASLKTTVADRTEASIDLEPGVELVEVRDRTFRREGSRIVVPVGSLSRGEVKTVLLHVRTPAPVGDASKVARVSVGFADLSTGSDGRVDGALSAVTSDETDGMDPFVQIRVEKSHTADTLEQANELFRKGDVAAARAKIAAQTKSVKQFADENEHAKNDPWGSRGGDARDDSQAQLDSLNKAESGFASPPPPKPSMPMASPPSDPFAPSLKGNQAAATEDRR